MNDWSRRQICIAASAVPLAGAILAFDLLMPLGVAGGVPYALLVMLGLWLPQRGGILVLAVLGTALTGVGYGLSEAAGVPWMVMVNRALAVLMIWSTAGLSYFLHRQTAAAVAANQAKSKFLSAMSHELRTPMNAVLGFAQLLDQDTSEPLTESQKEFVNEILRSGHHMTDLINGVLDLARIDSGAIDVDLTDCAPGPMIAASLKMVSGAAERRGVTLASKVAEGDLPKIKVDALRFKQALINLLSNAVKYNCPNGEVTIECRVIDGATLRTTVSDTGEGIPSAMKDRVFEPFERLGAENSNIPGTGIGLTVTKQLIESMGGAIGFESTVGKGSTFWIESPVSVSETS